MSFEPTFYYSNNTARENFTSPVFFNAISLHGSEKVLTHTHTHTHTHRPDLLISFFIRAREECRIPSIHGDSERILRAVFRILSGSEIRENKERISRQKPYDFQAAICRVSTSMNPHSGVSPHVGTDPVSVRSIRQDGMNIWVYNPGYGMRSVDRVGMEADRHGVCPYMRAGARVTPLSSPLATTTNKAITK